MARPKKKKNDELIINSEVVENVKQVVNNNEPVKFEDLNQEDLLIVIQYERVTAPVFGRASSSITLEKVEKKYKGAYFPRFVINTMKRVIDNWK